MIKSNAMWECECGHIEYGDIAPDECPSCFKIDSFAALPEEIMEERQKELGADLEEDFEEAPARKIKKPTRRKKRK